jgi:protoporphyrinogen oxidase
MKPVVIVGAGLAGLTCARALKRSRTPFLLLEAGDRIGGRIKSDHVSGFHLERGAQVYFTAYPNAKGQLDEVKLDIKRYEPGATVIWDGEQHVVSRERPLQMAISGFLGMADKLRLASWMRDIQWLDPEDIEEIDDCSIEEYLVQQGFSTRCIDRFFRPFLSSFFLDRSLSDSGRQLVFLWKVMDAGFHGVPALGMEEIPRQIGATFSGELLRVNCRVTELVKEAGTVTGVRLEDGERIEASTVILACEASAAGALSGIALPASFRSCVRLYFTTPTSPLQAGWIALNGNARGIVNHLILYPFSATSSQLVSTTILGERSESDDQLAEIVKAEMRVWFPGHEVESWKFLRGYRGTNAQMAQPPGFKKSAPGNDSGIPGLFFAGEFTTNSSIDGAIQSGIDCADLILDRVAVGAA